MGKPSITMPHRHTVRYDDEGLIVDFEVELLQKGIAFYRNSAKVITGDGRKIETATTAVEDWIKSKFEHVEIDLT